MLDEMCQREEDRVEAAGKSIPDMKLKVHYFYRVPNNGLYVRLNEYADGSFKIYTENSIGIDKDGDDKEEAPLLELSRCKHCGEYVAIAMVNTDPAQEGGWAYEPLTTDDSDMFDLVEVEDDASSMKYAIFGLSNGKNLKGDNNVKFSILPNGKLQPLTPGQESEDGTWHVIGNTQCCCPYCNTKQTTKRDTEKELEGDANGNMEDNRLQKFVPGNWL